MPRSDYYMPCGCARGWDHWGEIEKKETHFARCMVPVDEMVSERKRRGGWAFILGPSLRDIRQAREEVLVEQRREEASERLRLELVAEAEKQCPKCSGTMGYHDASCADYSVRCSYCRMDVGADHGVCQDDPNYAHKYSEIRAAEASRDHKRALAEVLQKIKELREAIEN